MAARLRELICAGPAVEAVLAKARRRGQQNVTTANARRVFPAFEHHALAENYQVIAPAVLREPRPHLVGVVPGDRTAM